MAEKCPRKLVQVRNVIRLNQRLNYENSDQILALDVLLFVQIKMLFATTILALRISRYYCFATDRHVIRPPLKPEVNLTVHFR